MLLLFGGQIDKANNCTCASSLSKMAVCAVRFGLVGLVNSFPDRAVDPFGQRPRLSMRVGKLFALCVTCVDCVMSTVLARFFLDSHCTAVPRFLLTPVRRRHRLPPEAAKRRASAFQTTVKATAHFPPAR